MSSPASTEDSREVVASYFDSVARYWLDVYDQEGLQGLIYRQRMEATLRWVAELGLPPGAAVLEVGCGAGLLTLALANSGLRVVATDASTEMTALARRQAERAGVSEAIEIARADARDLPYPPASFDLVLALGLLPWLADPGPAVAEMARVVRPGGWVVLSADNHARLNFLSEPREIPLLLPLKLGRRALKRLRGWQPPNAQSYLHRISAVDRLLAQNRLAVARRTTVGFGPFTFLGRPLLSDAAATRLHHHLHALSEHRARALRRHGWHYLVAARRES